MVSKKYAMKKKKKKTKCLPYEPPEVFYHKSNSFGKKKNDFKAHLLLSGAVISQTATDAAPGLPHVFKCFTFAKIAQ